MRLSAGEEVGAPAAAAFARLAEFERVETAARERGVEVERLGEAPMRWRVAFEAAGVLRVAEVRLTSLAPPEGAAPGRIDLEAAASGVAARIALAVAPLGEARCLLGVEATLRGTGLGGRVLLGTLALGAGRIERAMAERLAAFGRDLEARRGDGR